MCGAGFVNVVEGKDDVSRMGACSPDMDPRRERPGPSILESVPTTPRRALFSLNPPPSMTQSRFPPSLLYLTIYNPTLKPAHLDPDNEDAEEQAHILFYTAREHAVSRDRILRQIGLAKALVNFSE